MNVETFYKAVDKLASQKTIEEMKNELDKWKAEEAEALAKLKAMLPMHIDDLARLVDEQQVMHEFHFCHEAIWSKEMFAQFVLYSLYYFSNKTFEDNETKIANQILAIDGPYGVYCIRKMYGQGTLLSIYKPLEQPAQTVTQAEVVKRLVSEL